MHPAHAQDRPKRAISVKTLPANVDLFFRLVDAEDLLASWGFEAAVQAWAKTVQERS